MEKRKTKIKLTYSENYSIIGNILEYVSFASGNSNGRFKQLIGKSRQEIIIDILGLWSYSEIAILEKILGIKHGNIYKVLNILMKKGLIKKEKYHDYSILSLTNYGKKQIINRAGISDSKSNFKREVSYLSHQLFLQKSALEKFQFYFESGLIVPVKFEMFLKYLYHFCGFIKKRPSLIKKIHKADYILLFRESEDSYIYVIGVEIENSRKSKFQMKKKFESMGKNLGTFFDSYYFEPSEQISMQIIKNSAKKTNSEVLEYTNLFSQDSNELNVWHKDSPYIIANQQLFDQKEYRECIKKVLKELENRYMSYIYRLNLINI